MLEFLSDARTKSFNTQPPEGGWHPHLRPVNNRTCFNTQPPEGGWQLILCSLGVISLFQHTAARRRLEQPKAVRLYL